MLYFPYRRIKIKTPIKIALNQKEKKKVEIDVLIQKV